VSELGAKVIADHRVRYLMVGAGTNVLYICLFWLGWHLLEGIVSYLIVTAATNLSTALIVYPVYRGFVFGSEQTWLRGFWKFYTVYLVGLGVSLVGMPLLVEIIGVPVVLAQAILLAVQPVISYLLHRFWTFA
jgi:putative flippase GtrA